MNLDRQLSEIRQSHFPNPPAAISDLQQFENRYGCDLPWEMTAFYRECDGAELFRRPNSPYRLMRVGELCRARQAIFGEDTDDLGPSTWYAFCDVADGNYVAIVLDDAMYDRFTIRDCFHEAFPDPDYCPVIAHSFGEFLARALNSGGELYWL